MKQLSTSDISKALAHDLTFLGVFALNRLPTQAQVRGLLTTRRLFDDSTLKLVANLQYSNLPGSHWVAALVQDGQGHYFDSFGSVPPLEMQHWLNQNSSDWTWNTKVVQSMDDNVLCGYLCIDFLNNA